MARGSRVMGKKELNSFPIQSVCSETERPYKQYYVCVYVHVERFMCVSVRCGTCMYVCVRCGTYVCVYVHVEWFMCVCVRCGTCMYVCVRWFMVYVCRVVTVVLVWANKHTHQKTNSH